jgi:hypothetical protein
MKNFTVLLRVLLLTVFFILASETYAKKAFTLTWRMRNSTTKDIQLAVNPGKIYTIRWGDGNTTRMTGNGTFQKISYTYNKPLNSYNVEIHTDNLKDVTGINVYANEVLVLNVRDLPFLKTLDCSANALLSLDLTGIKSLVSVNCSYNPIRTLKITGLASIEKLYCADNAFATLDVRHLQSLKELDCSFGKLTSLQVNGLSKLQTLKCQRNVIKDLELTNLKSLIELDCAANELTALDLTALKNLEKLNCTSNTLQELKIENLTKLLEILCSENKLLNLNLTGLTLVKHLNCSWNKLTELDLFFLKSLEILDCNDNYLTNLDVNHPLKGINCSNNKLQLSNLYSISQQVKARNNKILGKQELPEQHVLIKEKIDLSSQAAFGDFETEFTVLKNNHPAITKKDYKIKKEKITFKTQGNYTIVMKNAAIESSEDYPAEVFTYFSAQ